MTAPAPQKRERKFRPTRGASLIALFLFATLIALGVWQVKRLAWKTALLAGIARDMAAAPQPLPAAPDPQALEYHHVTMAGHFLYAHEYLVKPRMRNGQEGYDMIVPFARASGSVVFVNRGWASDAVAQKIERPKGMIEVEGIVHTPKRNYFTPANAPARHEWYWPDIAQMSKDAGLSNVAPVFVTVPATKAGTYPAGGGLHVDIPNDHKQYAIFWFGMACVQLVIYYLSQLRYVDDANDKRKKNDARL